MNPALPIGMHVFERGWLSSNNVLIMGEENTALIDSGYCTHSEQTVALVHSVLGDRPLDLLINTHLHSDHCGGNAALQEHYPALQTRIPPGNADEVKCWDEDALTYKTTGQQCPKFVFEGLLTPGETLSLGGCFWQIHAAAGHDPHSILLFEPHSRGLISADSLWQKGFVVVFPELGGVSAFPEVGATLDLIETLEPKVVIPGHGRPFSDYRKSLRIARSRLNYFIDHPAKHQQYAAKVLIKFKLLELQSCTFEYLLNWVATTPYMELLRQEQYPQLDTLGMVESLVGDLVRSGAVKRDSDQIRNGS